MEGLYINIETIIYRAGAQNPTISKDLDEPIHPCSLISLSFHWSVIGAGACFVLLKVTCSPCGINRIGLVGQDLDYSNWEPTLPY